MPKLILNDLSNLQNEQSAVALINSNNTAIETAIENTLSRDGSTPNSMEADLDMNSNSILNLPEATEDTEPIRKQEFDTTVEDLETQVQAAIDAAAGAVAVVDEAVAELDAAVTAAQLAETNAETAQAAAELAETNAETAETNAEQAEVNAELAETNAEVAQAAAELAQAEAEAAAAATAESLVATSTTSLLIEEAIKVFTIQADKFFHEGDFVLVTSDANADNYMYGTVTTYSGTTLTLEITHIGGSGTFADWTLRFAGAPGADGAGNVNSVFGRTGDVVATASDYDADQVDFTPAGNIAASDVQAAIEELDTEKAATGHNHDGVYQPLDADLTAVAALTTAAYGLDLLETTDEENFKALVNLEIGTDVQAWDADLDAVAALTTPATTITNSLQRGKHTIYIPASAMIAATTSGPASAQVETSTNDINFKVLDFDASSDEHAHFNVCMPKSWDEGTVTFQAWWTTSATDTDGVAWGLQGVAVSDNEASDASWGTAVVVTDDAQSAALEILTTSESGAITIGGTPAEGDIVFFRVFRDVSDANDDMTEDARLIGIKLFITLNASTDT